MSGGPCYICGAVFGAFERDHFPVSRASGGTHTEAICVNCHTAKDRIGFGTFNPSDAFVALAGLWEKAAPAERIMLAKMIAGWDHAATVAKGRRGRPRASSRSGSTSADGRIRRTVDDEEAGDGDGLG